MSGEWTDQLEKRNRGEVEGFFGMGENLDPQPATAETLDAPAPTEPDAQPVPKPRARKVSTKKSSSKTSTTRRSTKARSPRAKK